MAAKTLFIQPQELAIHLRPGVKQSFHLSVSPPAVHSVSELVLDTSPVPASINLTIGNISTGNGRTVEASRFHREIPRCNTKTLE